MGQLQYFGHPMRRCKELTHWKRPWCWERLKAGGEEDGRGWDGWVASATQQTWVWVNSRNWWWTGRPGVLRFMGSQRVGHDWATDLIWSELQHVRLPCPPRSPGVCSNSWPLSQWCYWPSHPLYLSPSVFPSINSFFSESALCIRWLKYWSFSFSVSASNEYSGLISFRIDWFELLSVQGTLKSLLQNHSLKASILWCSVFFTSSSHIHTYMTIGKTIALTLQTFVSKVSSLPCNSFPSKSKHFLILWLQSLCTVILKPKKIKSETAPLNPLLFAMRWYEQMPWS